MSQYKARIADKDRTIKTLAVLFGIFIFIFGIGVVVMFFKSTKTNESIYSPPSNPLGMTVDKNGIAPDCYVYMFQFNLLNHIYHWSESGEEDFLKNIESHKIYLGSKSRKLFMDQLEVAKAERRLDRVRQPYSADNSYICKPDYVENVGDGVWKVKTILKMEESKRGAIIRDPMFEYNFYVRQVVAGVIPKGVGWASRQNPVGLVLYAPVSDVKRVEKVN